MSYQHFSVRPLTGALGGLVDGLDLSQALSDEAFAELCAAWHKYQVLFFRDQDLTPEQQLAFGRRFGEVDPSAFIPTLDGFPDIRVQDMQDYRKLGTDINWHCDNSFREYPQKCSALYAREVPTKGGDTSLVEYVPGLRIAVTRDAKISRRADGHPRSGRNHGAGHSQAIRRRALAVL